MKTSTPTHPAQLRALIATGEWTCPTAGILDDYQQANLVIVPASAADEFSEYCRLNADACPLLVQGTPGDPLLNFDGCAVDVRSDLPKYRVWQNNSLIAEPYDIGEYWRDDAVAFALGCSHTFDAALRRAAIPVAATAPPVYITTRQTTATARFAGPLVVSMRPVPSRLVGRAIEVSERYPTGHGRPVHIGDPAHLGIEDLTRPDYGIYPGMDADSTPVFWACGVTPQLALSAARLPYAITHFAGHMLVFDTLLRPVTTKHGDHR